MARRADRRAAYADLEELPEHLVGEIMDGELIVTPRPATAHAFAGSMLGADLVGEFGHGRRSGGPGGWWILDEPELHLQADVLVPDLAAWRHERMPRLPNVPAIELAPDWVCEIVSPSTARFDRTRKSRIYRRERVAHMWIVDPLARSLEVYRLGGGSWTVVDTYGDDAPDKIRAWPFEAVELEPARWWLPEEPA